jgi:predicted ATPase
MKREVFICHSADDARVAAEVCDCLEADGIGCWIAPRDPVAGIPYGQQLVTAIEAAPILLLIFSASANQSRAVLSEVELASNRRKIILPVRIGDVLPSPGLEFYVRAIHWFDAAAQPEDRKWTELVRQVRELIGRRADDDAFAKRAPNAAPPHNLPLALTSFVGRERDVVQVEALLATSRLVTLCGPGGIGKTSLAIAVAKRNFEAYSDGAWFVDLAQVVDSASVANAFALTFHLHESPGASMLDALLSHSKNKRLLLIVDNCEQVIAEAARVVDAILQGSPNVAIIATTREPLAVRGETVYRVPSLAVPSEGYSRTLTATEALQYGAIELFYDRARAANRSFALTDESAPAIAAICRRLDGIALAIELAAARVKVLSPKDIAASLDDRFRLLTEGTRTALPRQKTLRAMIDWSYALLSEEERSMFRWLAVFAGSFSLADAIAVCSNNAPTSARLDAGAVLDLLASLIDKSLLQADFAADETRYMLLESMRAYANGKLREHRELEALSRAHAIAFLQTAETLERAWETTPDAEWRRLAEPQLDNSRAALRWAFGTHGDVRLGQRLVAAMAPTWFAMAPSEGRRWIQGALERLDEGTPAAIAAALALSEAHLAMLAQQYKDALSRAERARELFGELKDSRGKALANMFAGAALGLQGDVAQGTALLEASLEEFRRSDSRRTIGAALNYLGILQLASGNVAASRPFFYEALSLLKSVGAARAAAHIALYLAEAEFREGDAAKAVQMVTEALTAERALNLLDSVAFDLCNLAAYLVALDSWDEAREHALEALSLALEREIGAATVWALQHLSAISALRPSGDGSARDRRIGAQLAGFVDARIAELSLQRDFTEKSEYERVIAALGDVLGSEASLLLEEGRGWHEARAVEEARTI